MEIIITSGQILSFMVMNVVLFIGILIGYFIGKHDNK